MVGQMGGQVAAGGAAGRAGVGGNLCGCAGGDDGGNKTTP